MYSFSEKSPEEKGLYIMKTVNGICTSAKIFTDSIEDYALAQIRMLCDDEAFRGSKIRIMPDVHPGKVGTIGFTATVGKEYAECGRDRYRMRSYYSKTETEEN